MKQDIFEEIGRVNEQIKILETEITSVKNEMVVLEEREVLFFLNQLKNGDINNVKYRKVLIATFVNKIYLYDDKITFVFNLDNRPVTITHNIIDEVIKQNGCSDLMKVGSPSKNRLNTAFKRFLCAFLQTAQNTFSNNFLTALSYQ